VSSHRGPTTFHDDTATMEKRPFQSQFCTEWKAFSRAFRKSPEFNPFAWIFRLVAAAGNDVCEFTGFRWRPIVPFLGVFIVLALVASYTWKLRDELVQPRWCASDNYVKPAAGWCSWMYMHDFLVFYLTSMTLFHFIRTSVLSPGILITQQIEMQSHKGGLRLNYSIDVGAEQGRLSAYGTLLLQDKGLDDVDNKNRGKSLSRTIPSSTTRYHPSPYASFCDKCDTIRPPRCHHCRICNRCVMQFDHHCVWLNNCIGFNNVRSFILTLVYITAACWYGVLLLYKPFYGPLRELLQEYGGMWSYMKLYMSNNSTDVKGVFDLPSLTDVKDMIFSSEEPFPVQVVVDVVFPFVLGVGGILAVFLGSHVKYILSAFTTLEHRVKLARLYDSLIAKIASTESPSESLENWVNPFDQGSMHRNWTQIMGRSWFVLFFPVALAPPPPYIPGLLKKKN
jgi:hypothetical protein